MVEEMVQDACDYTEYDPDVVTPPPASGRVLDQQSSNDGAEDGEREGREEDDGDDGPTVLVRDKLA